jgi:hypothetical protein
MHIVELLIIYKNSFIIVFNCILSLELLIIKIVFQGIGLLDFKSDNSPSNL